MIDEIGYKTLEIMSKAINYNRRLLNLISPWLKGKVLEVGAGRGTFVSAFIDKGLDVSALDINLDYLKLLRKQFPNLSIYKLDLQAVRLPESLKGQFDTVVMLNVLEHIEDDSKALQNIYHMLRPDGALILIVPAHQWAFGTLDQNLSHFRRYDKTGLKNRLGEVGFEIQRLKHISPVAIFGWWWVARVLRRPILSQDQVSFFDPLVPTIAVIEDILMLPFGLSLFVVAKKP